MAMDNSGGLKNLVKRSYLLVSTNRHLQARRFLWIDIYFKEPIKRSVIQIFKNVEIIHRLN